MFKDDPNEPISSHDRRMLKEFYVCFDRPAFRVNFLHESNIDDLDMGLEDTIAALNTGIKKRRDGIVFGKASDGKVYFENQDLRKAFDEIVTYLTEARILYADAKKSDFFFRTRSGYAFHRDHDEEAVRVAVMMDELRNRVLEVANGVYSKFKMPEFPYIQTSDHYRRLARLPALQIDVPSSKFKFWSLNEIIEFKPSFFGVSININRILEKLRK
ncbi:MAG: hypothetical protein GY834_04585 [Bacteroidetes bacterium]|nr:hypothetical protein [Bacteroidota bacterium]